MYINTLLVIFCTLGPYSLCTEEVEQNRTDNRRDFYGLDGGQLNALHQQHQQHINKLKEEKLKFPWPHFSVNKTCPELNWTFHYEEPFLHMALPACGDVIKPTMKLLHKDVECELDPFYLPNNKTDNCTRTIMEQNQINEIVIISHGFLKSISSSWMHELGSYLINASDTRAILLVGWGHGSGGLPFPDPFYYYQAAANTRYMGVSLAKMVTNLLEAQILHTNRLDLDTSLHCIGHSLGAHICGFLGKNLKNLTHYKLRRISGLDPAGPLFAIDVPYPFNFIHISPEARLNKEDAGFVDVIHTDGRARFTWEVIPQYGTMIELGHVDFFPGSKDEFGWNQPGCWQFEDIGSCSHSRSHDLFISSLAVPCTALQTCTNSTVIPATCSNITTSSPTMGYWVDRENFSGTAFTVLTNSTYPFCQTIQPLGSSPTIQTIGSKSNHPNNR